MVSLLNRFLLILVLLILPAIASAQQTIFTPYCDGADTARFTALISTIGANNATISLPYKSNSAQRCTVNNLTIPANIQLTNIFGSGIKVNTGQQLIIASSYFDIPRQGFFNALSGQGTVSFAGSKKMRDFSIEWWGGGAGVADNSPAMQACIDAIVTMDGGGTIQFVGSTYTFLSTVIVGNQLSGTSGPNFTMISMQGQGVSKTNLTWGGATNGTMFKFWRNKLSSFSQIKFLNGVAMGTTIGVHLTGPASGTQSNNLIFTNCDFDGFNKGVRAGGGALGTEAASEISFDLCNFTANDIGFAGDGTGNTLNIWFRGCSFGQNISHGAAFGAAGAVSVNGGGSNANGVSTFELFGGWQSVMEISNFRFELTIPERAIRSGGPESLIVRSCLFQTNTTVPTYAVISTQAQLLKLDGNQFGIGADTGWITAGEFNSTQGQPDSLVMENNSIRGTIPFYIDPGNSSADGLKYRLFGNNYNGKVQPPRTGLIAWPEMVDDELRGTATFASAGTKAVTITTRESALYDVLIEKAVNEDIWVTSKTTTGFTLNSSNATSTAVINYVIRRQ